MGRNTFSAKAYDDLYQTHVPRSGSATRQAEEEARRTGKLDPLVDPAEYGVIRPSRPRFVQRPDGLWELTIGTPMPIETRGDTTASMGDNVEIILRVLPQLYQQCERVLPGYDIHVATGIFGDCSDRFVLCRPQFEMVPEKILNQLTLMAPQRGGGGNGGEDPHYGLFGGAYLVNAYINRIGLKGYDFTVTDEPARPDLRESQLTRIFGPEVFDKAATNGHPIDRNDLPTTKEVAADLLQRAHAFVLLVPPFQYNNTESFWTDTFGPERVIMLPRADLLTRVQAIIIGLTEGTLSLNQVGDLLREARVTDHEIEQIAQSVANIPIGAQMPLRQNIRVPQAGDLFREKTDLWPLTPDELAGLGIDPSQPPVGNDRPEGTTWL